MRLHDMQLLRKLLSDPDTSMRERRIRILVWLLAVFFAMVAIFSVVFHVIMEHEGQGYSWFTGIYWSIVTMSTLGFGDITFESDIGRFFSLIVLVTGVAFLLVLLPFTFVNFLFKPWMERRDAARAPRKVERDMSDHVVLTKLDVVTDAFIGRMKRVKVPYVLLVPDLGEALTLHDRGYHVMLGELDDPQTYHAARVEHAALVATTGGDMLNTNIVSTVREIDQDVTVVATVSSEPSLDILELAGASEILRLGDMLGRAMAQRALGGNSRTHVVGEFGNLLVAEANVAGTSIVNQTIAQTDLRSRLRVNIVGLWQRGRFEAPSPGTVLEEADVLILVGNEQQLAAYDTEFASQRSGDAPAVIIGGGRVGRAAGRALAEAGIRYKIIEQRKERVRDPALYVRGDAAERDVLERAGLSDAGAAIITTHDDDVNVYLTLYCRKLQPDLQIISRANAERNVSTLHRAGADSVLSFASIGASAIWNALELSDTLVLAEGLEMFRTSMPASLAGRTLIDAAIATTTGCNIVATVLDGVVDANPDPAAALPADADLILIGDSDAENAFLARHPVQRRPAGAVADRRTYEERARRR